MRIRVIVMAAVVCIVLAWVSAVLSGDGSVMTGTARPTVELMSRLHQVYPCNFPGRDEPVCEAHIPHAGR
jgi:hypothetical protein